MCFAKVEEEPASPTVVGAPEQAPSPTAGWPCPVCERINAIELDACVTCGTTFGAAMRRGGDRPAVDPDLAFRRSLLYPGLGHRLVGRELDGFARGVLFAMLLLATAMLASSGVSSGALGAMLLLYATATLTVYLGSAIEARRLAAGGSMIVSSRALLWASVAILLVSVVVVSLVIGTGSRG